MSGENNDQRPLRDRVVIGPLPPSFLRVETRTSSEDGTVTTVTADPALQRQVELPPQPNAQPTTQPNLTRNRTQPQPNLAEPRPVIPVYNPVNYTRPVVLAPTYAQQAGYSITIAQAVLNKSYTLIGSMDPYVKLRVGHNVYETFTAVGQGKNPRWNKIYHCPIPNQSSVGNISIEIFDEKALHADTRIAWTNISIPNSVFEGHTIDEWFPLTGKLGEEKEGSINVIISYTTVPMITSPHQRIHYPYGAQVGTHYIPRPAPPASETDINTVKDMFPDVDKDVIKAILESNHGNVENTVTAILQMNEESSQQ